VHTLIAVEFASLDGVMQSPGRPDEDTSGGFTQGGWANAHLADDPEGAMFAMSGQNETVGILFGHRTYVDLVGYWLGTPDPNPFADILRETPKYVTTRDADTQLAYPNSTALVGDAADTVRALKESGEGELILLGSAELLHTLQEADLVDGYILTVIPVILGGGHPLFTSPSAPADLTLTRSTVSPKGTFVGEYRRR
jgi:dihydrofolate reductase